MIETGATNDNEIVVKQGLSKDDRVLLTAPTDKAEHQDRNHSGTQADRHRRTSGDTAKGVTLPAKPEPKPGAKTAAPTPAGKPAPATAPIAKPKG